MPANPDANLNVGKGLVVSTAASAPVAKQAAPVPAASFNPEMFGQAVGEAVQRQLEPIRSRLAALEAGR